MYDWKEFVDSNQYRCPRSLQKDVKMSEKMEMVSFQLTSGLKKNLNHYTTFQAPR